MVEAGNPHGRSRSWGLSNQAWPHAKEDHTGACELPKGISSDGKDWNMKDQSIARRVKVSENETKVALCCD